MLFSLIHTEIGSSSQFKFLAFGPSRLIQSLFGYHHLTLSLMEPLVGFQRRGNLVIAGDCFVNITRNDRVRAIVRTLV